MYNIYLNKKMKKHVLILMLILFTGIVNAQDNDASDSGKSVVNSGKSLVKINLLSLPLRNYSLGYEYKIGNKITAGLGFRFMPNGKLPMLSSIKKIVDDTELSKQLDNVSMSNTAISPEIRFYLGKQAMRGFYLAPFSRISSYKLAVPIEFEVNSVVKSIPMNGDLKTFTAGLQIGAQWKLAGRVYLDWWILGPQYGSAKGSISGTKTLTADEQASIKAELESLEIANVETTTTVNGNGARLEMKGPWAGLRAGLNLGIRF